MFSKHTIGAAVLAATITSFPALADETKVGDLMITTPMIRATPESAKVSAGYMIVHNHGASADTLTGGSVDFADEVEIHTMTMENNVMKMRELENGLEVNPGEMVKLKPGGYHIMFIGLKEQMKPDEVRKVTLTFQEAGEAIVDFQVVDRHKLRMKKHSHN